MRTEHHVNGMTIHRIVEQEQGFIPMLEFLPGLQKEVLEANLSWLALGGYNPDTGNIVLCYQSYVPKTPHHNTLHLPPVTRRTISQYAPARVGTRPYSPAI